MCTLGIDRLKVDDEGLGGVGGTGWVIPGTGPGRVEVQGVDNDTKETTTRPLSRRDFGL